jgi:hypothetical protein
MNDLAKDFAVPVMAWIVKCDNGHDRLWTHDAKAAREFADSVGARAIPYVSHDDYAELLARCEAMAASCAWTYDEHSYSWDSACGEKWTFMEDGLEENNVRYCHGCGHPVAIDAIQQSGSGEGS